MAEPAVIVTVKAVFVIARPATPATAIVPAITFANECAIVAPVTATPVIILPATRLTAPVTSTCKVSFLPTDRIATAVAVATPAMLLFTDR